jgi:hypothetical protein
MSQLRLQTLACTGAYGLAVIEWFGPGIGIGLSNGGFRAMLFHGGAWARLNEHGMLFRTKRISRASGWLYRAGHLHRVVGQARGSQVQAVSSGTLRPSSSIQHSGFPAQSRCPLMPLTAFCHVCVVCDRRIRANYTRLIGSKQPQLPPPGSHHLISEAPVSHLAT